MKSPFRDLFKHSAVYGIGQVLRGLSSFLMLPVYTNYLRPADYGIIAILDFTTAILAITIGSGMVNAVTRYSFAAKDEVERNRVWWTGVTYIAGISTIILLPAIVFRDSLAAITLGSSVSQGGFYLALVLPTMWINIVQAIPDAYLRVRKWSGVSVAVNMFRLIFNISLNVAFLVVWELGVTGVLLGNLIAVVVTAGIQFIIFSRQVQSFDFSAPHLTKLLQFGMPLIATTLLALVMHQADRYILRLFVGLDQVGIYALAYTVGRGVFSLCLMPFSMIWSVVIYEIAKRPDAKQIYAQVFEYVIYGLGLIMLGVALFSEDLLSLMVEPDYLPAAKVIPIICLAYVFFGMHDHFRVPVLLEKKTVTLVPVFLAGALFNVGANFLVIPIFGMYGAAWTSVLTYVGFSFIGLWRYRRIDRYDYPFGRCAFALGGMILTYIGFNWFLHSQDHVIAGTGLAIFMWCVWVFLLFGNSIRKLVSTGTVVDFKTALLFIKGQTHRG